MRTLAAVTTMNRPYYDTIGRYMLESFVRYWPQDLCLYIYTEDFELPMQAPNIQCRDIYHEVGPRLRSFLDWRGQHHTRKFAFKAYSWMRATESLDEDVLFYLDSDIETKKPVTKDFLLSLIPQDTLLAYMYARATSIDDRGQEHCYDNAETCIYAYNQRHPFAKRFMQRYSEIYETREIGNQEVYRKSHDTWVIAECVRLAQQNGVSINNLHPEKQRRSPIKATVLYEFFNHYKGKTKFAVKT